MSSGSASLDLGSQNWTLSYLLFHIRRPQLLVSGILPSVCFLIKVSLPILMAWLIQQLVCISGTFERIQCQVPTHGKILTSLVSNQQPSSRGRAVFSRWTFIHAHQIPFVGMCQPYLQECFTKMSKTWTGWIICNIKMLTLSNLTVLQKDQQVDEFWVIFWFFSSYMVSWFFCNVDQISNVLPCQEGN